MLDSSYRNIRALLASTDPEKLRLGLQLAGIEIVKAGPVEAKPLFEIISPLFYIDTLDHPELISILDEATSLAAQLSPSIIPVLLKNLNAGDFKAQWAIAHVLGRIGSEAIKPMMEAYESSSDHLLRTFILYAMGKIKSLEIIRALPLVLDAARSPDLEMRDTATRTLGKLVEAIPPEAMPEKLKLQIEECLHHNLSDTNASVRAKAIRSLGKLSRYGYLTDSARKSLRAVCQHILGTDQDNDWDRAFVVRKEAGESLNYT
jgi:hypothetical protein